jgi:hypothetical protein
MESKLNLNKKKLKKNLHIIYFKERDIMNNTSSEGDV